MSVNTWSVLETISGCMCWKWKLFLTGTSFKYLVDIFSHSKTNSHFFEFISTEKLYGKKRICEVWYNSFETIEFNENGVSSIDSIVYEGFFMNRFCFIKWTNFWTCLNNIQWIWCVWKRIQNTIASLLERLDYVKRPLFTWYYLWVYLTNTEILSVSMQRIRKGFTNYTPIYLPYLIWNEIYYALII